MTFREKLMQEHPEEVNEKYDGGCYLCPEYFGYEAYSSCSKANVHHNCYVCWDREIPENNTAPAKEKKGENKMKTAEIRDAIRDRIAEQIKPSDIEDAILTAVFEFDFRETISYALEDAIGAYISDFVNDLTRNVVGEVVNDKLNEYFN